MRRALVVVLAAAFVSSCGGSPPPLTVLVTESDRALMTSFFEFVPLEGVRLQISDDPFAELDDAAGLRIAVMSGLSCDGCDADSYHVEGSGDRFTVWGGGKLGLQYGVTEVLESFGLRFFHPRKTHVPADLSLRLPIEGAGSPQIPEMTLRGLHLHTLHPIEAYFDFWEPGDAQLDGAKRTVDWVVKNRGNYIQYTALDDILADEELAERWRAHTKTIVDYAHARGVRMGVGIQLFGKSNLQKAFDLIDGEPEDPRAEMKRRLELLLRDVGFDAISLSYGEFSATRPDVFVANVNTAVKVMHEVSPGIEINTVIHVGDQPELRVTYQGETLLYYFLVKFADQRLIPWVHTTMYYNLFEDAGLAYHHENFHEHRDFLLERLEAGKPVGYFPESAYWVAFDNCVPTYVPLYLRSRWHDLDQIRQARGGAPGLKTHALFSSGWEWGYWQTDYATLRSNFRLTKTWRDPVDQMFAPWGEAGMKLAEAIAAFTDAQHEGLIVKRLAAYVASRDQLMDAGRIQNIVSQPDRPEFSQIAAMTPEQRDAFAASVLVGLQTLAQKQHAAFEQLAAAGHEDDPWFTETRDGMAVTIARTRFIHALYSAVVARANGEDPSLWMQQAEAELAIGKEVVARRHANFHDPDGRRLLRSAENATVYPYGYLREAHSLCFWNRERIQVLQLFGQSSESPPACVSVDL